jgi:hypothetical protein
MSPWTIHWAPDWKARSSPAVLLNALEPIQAKAWSPPSERLASIALRSILSVPGVKSTMWSRPSELESVTAR